MTIHEPDPKIETQPGSMTKTLCGVFVQRHRAYTGEATCKKCLAKLAGKKLADFVAMVRRHPQSFSF